MAWEWWMINQMEEERPHVRPGTASRPGWRVALGTGALLAVTASSCASSPTPRPTTRPVVATLVSVAPTGYSYTLTWQEPVAQLTDGSNTLKVLGPGRVTIESVKAVIEPASTPVVVEWSGIEVVTGDLNDARGKAPGYATGATGVALRSTLEPAFGAVLRAGDFYNLVMLLQTTGPFPHPWTIVGTDVTYRVGDGSSQQTLRVNEQVQVE
jgi:hypothetical protein